MLVASAVTLRVSVMTATVRLLLAGTVVLGVFTGLLYLVASFSTRPRTFYPAVFLAVFAVTAGILASKPPDVEMLREAYLRRLSDFEGTRYVQGGETQSGVDSSGLARAALAEAMLKQSVMQANPRLIGPTFWKFWWRDMSAQDIADGKYGYTRVIGDARRLACYDTSRLLPGDMAVAGSHVLIYYDKGRWIEANPDEQKVVVNAAPADSRRRWFNTRVKLVRWWILEPRPSTAGLYSDSVGYCLRSRSVDCASEE